MTLENIKQAISELSADERGSLASWIIEQEYDAWDREMMSDFSPGGRGYHLVEEIKREISEGDFASLEQVIEAERNRS